MSGITIRGMSGNPAGVVLTGADTNSGMWWFVPSSPSAGDPPARFKGLTFVFTNRTVGNLYWTGGPLIMEDVVVDACSAADEIVHTDCVGDVTFLRCTFAGRNWTNGMNSQAFVGVWGAASNNATLRLVDCTAFGSGTNTSAYIVGGHAGGTPPEVYGGTYFDSSSRLIMSGGLGGAYSFFTKFPNTGPPFIRTNTAYTSMFGCRAETRGAGWFTIYPSLGVRSNAYLLFSSLSATNYPASSTMVGRIAVNEDTNDCPVAHNRITLDGGRFLTLSTGNKTYVGNIVRGAGEGARVYNYTSGNGMPSRLLGNTWVTNTLAVSYGFTNFALAMTNNAFVGNTTAFTMYDYIATNTLRAGYNIIDNTIDAGAYQWPASNTTNVNAAVSIITSIPTAAGNCDDTGLGYGWAADSDPWGLVWLFHPARAPIGAVSVQRTYADAVVFPDAW
jgi:predicted RNA-binding protein